MIEYTILITLIGLVLWSYLTKYIFSRIIEDHSLWGKKEDYIYKDESTFDKSFKDALKIMPNDVGDFTFDMLKLEYNKLARSIRLMSFGYYLTIAFLSCISLTPLIILMIVFEIPIYYMGLPIPIFVFIWFNVEYIKNHRASVELVRSRMQAIKELLRSRQDKDR